MEKPGLSFQPSVNYST